MSNDDTNRIYALCGKGGVGKTTVSAAIARIMSEDGKKTLAIDADPAVGLATVLGFRGAHTVDSIRKDLIARIEKGGSENREEIARSLDYDVFAAIEERGNLAFLAIGRPEAEGCYCKVNSMLRDIISSITGSFDCVVIDGEAGIEQVNRRVMETVTHLMIVSDSSSKGISVARTIHSVASEAVHYDHVGLVLNRIRNEGDIEKINIPAGIPLLGFMPESDAVREMDIAGKTIFGPEGDAVIELIRPLLRVF